MAEGEGLERIQSLLCLRLWSKNGLRNAIRSGSVTYLENPAGQCSKCSRNIGVVKGYAFAISATDHQRYVVAPSVLLMFIDMSISTGTVMRNSKQRVECTSE